jgi:hypothetical protein
MSRAKMRKWADDHLFELVIFGGIALVVIVCLMYFRGQANEFRDRCTDAGGHVLVEDAYKGNTYICLDPDQCFLFTEYI